MAFSLSLAIPKRESRSFVAAFARQMGKNGRMNDLNSSQVSFPLSLANANSTHQCTHETYILMTLAKFISFFYLLKEEIEDTITFEYETINFLNNTLLTFKV